jgi:hypothetical protein
MAICFLRAIVDDGWMVGLTPAVRQLGDGENFVGRRHEDVDRFRWA